MAASPSTAGTIPSMRRSGPRSSSPASCSSTTSPWAWSQAIRWPSLIGKTKLCSRAPEVSEALGEQVVRLTQLLRTTTDLIKPPGVAETLDWARALHQLGTEVVDVETAARTLGVAVKYREDADRVRMMLDRILSR